MEWTPACRADELDELPRQVVIAGRPICVVRVEGRVYATDDRCTHGDSMLSDGDLDGHEIECPYHQGRFDVRTGRATAPPCQRPIATHPAEERDGTIWLSI